MRKITTNPKNFDRELEILYEMGVDVSDIQYIAFKREKEIISQKWN